MVIERLRRVVVDCRPETHRECRVCGTTLDDDEPACSVCGSTEIATYEL